MSTALLERAKTKLLDNKRLRNTPGQEWHDDFMHCDKPASRHLKLDPYDPTENAGHPKLGRKIPPIDEHVIHFTGKRTVTFVGECATRTLAALNSWLEKYGPKEPSQWAELDGTSRKLCAEIPGLKIVDVDGVPSLILHKDTWNDFVLAIYQEGVGLCGLPEKC